MAVTVTLPVPIVPVAAPDPVVEVPVEEPKQEQVVVPQPEPMEPVMANVEQDVVAVIKTITTVVESPTFQALLPVVLGALKVGGASAVNPVAAGVFGAQLLADLAAALPVITPEAVQAGSSLVGAVMKTVASTQGGQPSPAPETNVAGVAAGAEALPQNAHAVS